MKEYNIGDIVKLKVDLDRRVYEAKKDSKGIHRGSKKIQIPKGTIGIIYKKYRIRARNGTAYRLKDSNDVGMGTIITDYELESVVDEGVIYWWKKGVYGQNPDFHKFISRVPHHLERAERGLRTAQKRLPEYQKRAERIAKYGRGILKEVKGVVPKKYIKNPGSISEVLQTLRKEVVEKGRKTNDERKIGEILDMDILHNFSPVLFAQAWKDKKCQYRYYVALGMWLNQAINGIFDDDIDMLIEMAKNYLAEIAEILPLREKVSQDILEKEFGVENPREVINYARFKRWIMNKSVWERNIVDNPYLNRIYNIMLQSTGFGVLRRRITRRFTDSQRYIEELENLKSQFKRYKGNPVKSKAVIEWKKKKSKFGKITEEMREHYRHQGFDIDSDYREEVYREDHTIYFKLWDTIIITATPEVITINTHGYRSKTTKQRINKYLRELDTKWQISQMRDQWYLWDTIENYKEKFLDGIGIDRETDEIIY